MPWCGSVIAFVIVGAIGGLFLPLVYTAVSIFGNCVCPSYGASGRSDVDLREDASGLLGGQPSAISGYDVAGAKSVGGVTHLSPFADMDAFSQSENGNSRQGDQDGFYSNQGLNSGGSRGEGAIDWSSGKNGGGVLSTRTSTPLCIAAWTLRSICVIAVVFTWVLGFAGIYVHSVAHTKKSGTMQFGHLQDEVTVTFSGAGHTHDGHGTVHISANSMHDAAFALGVNHAQMRLWQLEFQRRVGQGRLSEIVGDGGLEMDQLMRALDIYTAVKRAKPSLS